MKGQKWYRRRFQMRGYGCKQCFAGFRDAWFPVYGMAPHRHVDVGFGVATVIDSKGEWPDNFEPDLEQVEYEKETGIPPGQGTWYCPNTECVNAKKGKEK